ncbi:MAG: DUF98 domain-containing protein [Gemmatimonadaceae bacterium]|nr:DUF98 domain-containing protein [Gloeobacterales cyanobacterium ES-bin-141]
MLKPTQAPLPADPITAELVFHELNPTQRAFLVTDGTVTELLEAVFLEAIEVVKLSQRTAPLANPVASLAAGTGETGYAREVLLVGKQSRHHYVHASSIILLDRLPGTLRIELLETGKGIGHILRDHHIETFRQITGYWSEAAAGLADYFGLMSGELLLGRQYVVHHQGRPIMQIQERFAQSTFGVS